MNKINRNQMNHLKKLQMPNIVEILRCHAPHGITFVQVLKYLKENYLNIEKSGGWMPLVIEVTGPGPFKGTALSICHFYKQNGDVMYDPEITYEVDIEYDFERITERVYFYPLSYTQHGLGIYQEVIDYNQQIQTNEYLDLVSFSKMWDRNIGEQGFLDRLKEKTGVAAPVFPTKGT